MSQVGGSGGVRGGPGGSGGVRGGSGGMLPRENLKLKWLEMARNGSKTDEIEINF